MVVDMDLGVVVMDAVVNSVAVDVDHLTIISPCILDGGTVPPGCILNGRLSLIIYL